MDAYREMGCGAIRLVHVLLPACRLRRGKDDLKMPTPTPTSSLEANNTTPSSQLTGLYSANIDVVPWYTKYAGSRC
ncbi:hypothetical protein MUK42_13712 [Musa troglodytarum]|uniref:Uncharacterized protein n=1 Tax=Musa troglodytarum TaxID=320322 RepID=A0A9E7L2U7_9LILI|nr:hypothetical protein MUK42_13712 [Musa troglodytarum]